MKRLLYILRGLFENIQLFMHACVHVFVCGCACAYACVSVISIVWLRVAFVYCRQDCYFLAQMHLRFIWHLKFVFFLFLWRFFEIEPLSPQKTKQKRKRHFLKWKINFSLSVQAMKNRSPSNDITLLSCPSFS